MKKLAGLGLVLVLLALASPALARPTSFFCWQVEGTSCSGPGQTRTCADACGYSYTCTCTSWNGQYVWDCPATC